MAHVADLNGFVEGIATLLKDDGVAVIENPTCATSSSTASSTRSTTSTTATSRARQSTRYSRATACYLNDVEHFPDLHGGSLRWTSAQPRTSGDASVAAYLGAEDEAAADRRFEYYPTSPPGASGARRACSSLLRGSRPRAHGSPPTGRRPRAATLLNYVGIGAGPGRLRRRPQHPQARQYMPGVHLPICRPAELLDASPTTSCSWRGTSPDEIMRQQEEYLAPGGRFIVPVPDPRDRLSSSAFDPVRACSSGPTVRRLLRAGTRSRRTAAPPGHARGGPTFPGARCELGLCRSCGFITNVAFDAA